MGALESLQPSKVFNFFEEIAAIPHGSKNTKLISDYVVSVAKRHNLKYIQDDSNNVVVYKEACFVGTDVSDANDMDTVILQGHLDMVCEKTDDSDFDFSCEGLRLNVEDGFLKAEGTTLGGDDGIAVAYMLALMDSDDIPHPPLELVFTVDEEIGMLGAQAFDMSTLSGKKLLNIDSEEEGHLLVSCAGGATATLHFPILRRGAQGDKYRIVVSGLKGGHSGVEIDKGRANADIVLGKLLQSIFFVDDTMRVITVRGGLKDNAIPVKAEAFIVSKNETEVKNEVSRFLEEYRESYMDADPDLSITIEKVNVNSDVYPLDEAANLSFVMAYGSLPNGVIKMSEDIEGLVQTSLNLGIMDTFSEEITLSFSVRSSVNKEKEALIDELAAIVQSAGGTMTVEGEYPAWEYKEESKLRDVMTAKYEEMFQEKMVVEAIHAGVECGLFVDSIEGLDAVSFGPNIYDIHTPKERLDIASTERTWNFILAVLKDLM
ncbi:MAG: aminoacyl-histidine dipeptidase [Eubacterium sp.]|nr:aminoacyl-histidine dipeptidase [Eubacterium sp.]